MVRPSAGVNQSSVPPVALARDGFAANLPGVPKPVQCIVAVARNGVIGRAGRLPWHIPEDLAWFMDQTQGGVMIEGPACYAELGKALPGRGTVVISRDPRKDFPGAAKAADMAEALRLAEAMPWDGPIWITGGERIYAEGLPLCSRLYITRIHQDFEGDRRFPEDWAKVFPQLVWSQAGRQDGLEYTFEIRER